MYHVSDNKAHNGCINVFFSWLDFIQWFNAVLMLVSAEEQPFLGPSWTPAANSVQGFRAWKSTFIVALWK